MDPDTLASFLPIGLVARALFAPSGVIERGAVMFIDISGFTHLTNECIREDPERGVEDISQRLRAEFGTWIDLVAHSGGEVLKFAGDALLAFWRADGDELQDTAWRAATCARDLQNRHRGATDLQIRIGLEVGELHAVVVDLGPTRRDLLIAGTTLERALEAEAYARPGEVVCGPSAAAWIGEHVRGTRLDGGRLRLTGLRERAPGGDPVIRPPLPPPEELLRFLPPAAHPIDQSGEIRHVSTVFLSLPPGPIEEQRRILADIVAFEVELYGGVINKLNVDDKGLSALIAFGLPGCIYVDSAARTLYTVLALRRRHLPGLRLGIASGTALCGIIGNTRRREYTLIGSTVNRAARLMQACPIGLALCDQTTMEASQRTLEFRPHGDLVLHGHDALVATHEPLRVRERPPSNPRRSRFIGFRTELATLTALLGRLADPAMLPAVALIEGEIGCGKSRLAEAAVTTAADHRPQIFHVASEPDKKSIPYHAWSGVFHEIAGRLGHSAITAHLGANPELHPYLCLLNPLLGLNAPETEASGQLEPEVRAARTIDLLLALLQHGLADDRGIFLIEDAHWFDTASWALIVRLARSRLPVALVLTYEPWQHPPKAVQDLQELPGAVHLRLQPLSAADIRELVCVRLGVTDIPAAMFECIRDHAQGNLSRAKQLLHELTERGIIAVRDGRVHLGERELRDFSARSSTSDALITSRIDRLTARQQMVVRAAACIGRRFRVDLLVGVLHDRMARDELDVVIASLVALDMFTRDRHAAQASYQFTYPRTRDVIDAQMLTDHRRPHHRAIAECYERQGMGKEPWHAALLAHHWQISSDTDRAVTYFAAAGDYALAGYLCREAIDAYQAAVELAGPTRPPADSALWQQQSGVAALKLGEHDDARKYFFQALELLGVESGDRRGARVLSLIRHLSVQVWRRIRRRPTARPPGPVADQHSIVGTSRRVAHIYQGLAEVAFFNQERIRLLQATLASLNYAEEADEQAVLAWAYAIVAIVAGLALSHPLLRALGHRIASAYSGWSIAAADTCLTGTQAYAHLLQGVYHSTVPNRERVGYMRAAELFQGLGDRSREATARLADAFYRLALGDLPRAAAQCDAHRSQPDLAPQLRVWALSGYLLVALAREAPDPALVAELERLLTDRLQHADRILGAGVVALAHLRRGDHLRARDCAERAYRVMTEKPPTISYTSFGVHAAIEVFIALAGHDGAMQTRVWLRKARGAAARMRALASQNPIVAPRAALAQGQVACARGRLPQALKLWRRAQAQAERLALPYAESLAIVLIDHHTSGHGTRADDLRRAHDTLAGLGIQPDRLSILACNLPSKP